MCLAVPGRVIGIDGTTARVDFGGITREADLTLVPEAAVDSYVLVHAGFAIQVLNEHEAEETLNLFRDLAKALDEETPGERERQGGESGASHGPDGGGTHGGGTGGGGTGGETGGSGQGQRR
ncbi:MAG: HypC/HybG/HupF family hydrogenase formation chaperone [Armatimonadetes bacterium]|nr:HypC/HybG/HupF family hydrogenase formation chaperone [Armatimonadota bacterium]